MPRTVAIITPVKRVISLQHSALAAPIWRGVSAKMLSGGANVFTAFTLWCARGRNLAASGLIVGLLTLFAGPLAPAAELMITVVDAHNRSIEGFPVIAEPAVAAHAERPSRHAIMDQRNLQFVPEILLVQSGTLVDFPNSDQVLHQVYSFSPAKTFQLSLYAGRTHPPVLFDRPGVVTLGCNIHDTMVGYIYVTDSPYFGQTDASGQLALHQLPPGDYTIRAWHPRAAAADADMQQHVTLEAQQPGSVTFRLTQPLKPAMAGMSHGKGKWADY